MPDVESSSPTPNTAVAPRRRPWYRLHWSTWIVVEAVLAFFALMNIPGRVNSHSVFLIGPLFYEHGWPFVFMDRSDSPSHQKAFDDHLEKVRAKTFFPWADSLITYGSLEEGFGDGDPMWLNKNNWDFTGKWYIYQRWLAMDILIALFATVPLAAAYEFWSRRHWHYSLRFLLLCVFLIAVGMAWWRTGVNNYEREIKAVKSLHEKKYDVSLRCDAPVFLRIFVGKNNLRPFTYVDSITHFRYGEESPTPATDADLEHIGDLTRFEWLLLKDSSVTDKTLERLSGLSNLKWLSLDNTKITDKGLKSLHDLPNLISISLENTLITDDSLSSLTEFPQLRNLHLAGTKITDAGLRHLMELSNLSHLNLSFTEVTEEGLPHFAGMPKLKHLQLDGLPITDDGLKYLENMPQLGELEINGTKVTSTGIDKLQRALPNCQINWMMEVANPDETDQPTSEAENEEK